MHHAGLYFMCILWQYKKNNKEKYISI
jgi:hypothetical protein